MDSVVSLAMPPSLPVEDDPETCRTVRMLRQGLDADDLDLESLARTALLRLRALAEALEITCRAHEREARLSRMKTAYLRTIGHELSAPLASLREALAHLREPAVPGLPPAAAGHAAALRAIEASADWIAELREAMLDFARRDLDGA